MIRYSEEDLKQQIEEHEIISFDVFDTLLVRKTLFPHDVFEIVSEKLEEENIILENFKHARIEAELNNCKYDHTIYGIYENLQDISGISDSVKNRILECELDTEAEILIPREKMVEMFDFAKKCEKKVYLLSDMYLTQNFLGEVVQKCGIRGYEEFWISCEYKKSKYDGLFEIFKERIPGKSYLHIGDNPKVDGYYAECYGIDAFLVESAKDMAHFTDIEMQNFSLSERRRMGEKMAIEFNNPFKNL